MGKYGIYFRKKKVVRAITKVTPCLRVLQSVLRCVNNARYKKGPTLKTQCTLKRVKIIR